MGDRQGRIVAYDARRGLGTVEDGDGRRFGFHCTGFVDRGRDLAVGAPVQFQVVPGHLGCWEAAALRDASG